MISIINQTVMIYYRNKFYDFEKNYISDIIKKFDLSCGTAVSKEILLKKNSTFRRLKVGKC